LPVGSGTELYPDTARPRFFTVAGGEDYQNIDFLIQTRSSFPVSGKVELPKPKTTFSLALGVPGQNSLPVAQTLTQPDGTFRFERVPAGTYDLFVVGPDGGYGRYGSVPSHPAYFGRMLIQVAGQEIAGLSISLNPGATLKVSLSGVSDKPPAGCPAAASVSLTPAEPWGAFLIQGAQAGFGVAGTVKELAPGRYRVAAGDLGDGCYQARDVEVDLNGKPPDEIKVDLAAAGSIHGLLRAGASPASDFAVVLLADGREGAETAMTTPDAQGRFTYDGLRPGRYHITAIPKSDAATARWVGDLSKMIQVDIPGGSATEMEFPAPATAGKGGR
jgi:hypothetical protein